MKRLRTANQVVAHLGGMERVCKITRANMKQAYNWPGRAKSFPASTYVAMTRALAKSGAVAPARLWNMRGI